MLKWILLGTLIFAALIALGGWLFMLGWNYAVIQAVSVTDPIDYWTAVVLMVFFSAFVAGSRGSGK